jgi:hypothetical protein
MLISIKSYLKIRLFDLFNLAYKQEREYSNQNNDFMIIFLMPLSL